MGGGGWWVVEVGVGSAGGVGERSASPLQGPKDNVIGDMDQVLEGGKVTMNSESPS